MCVCVCRRVCVCVSMCAHTRVCVCVCARAHVYAHVYMCAYVHTYTFIHAISYLLIYPYIHGVYSVKTAWITVIFDIMIHSTETRYYTTEIHRIEIHRFLGISQYKFKFKNLSNLILYTGFWLDGCRGYSIVNGISYIHTVFMPYTQPCVCYTREWFLWNYLGHVGVFCGNVWLFCRTIGLFWCLPHTAMCMLYTSWFLWNDVT